MAMRSTNPNRLEQWLGRANVHKLSNDMRGWYGPPIAVGGVPGSVFACGDGDFVGECREGYYYSAMDRARDTIRRIQRGARIATSPKRLVLSAGAASLSDLISECTSAQKRLEMTFNKAGSLGVVNVTNTLWRVGTLPQAGGAGSAPAAGRVPTSATTGAFNSLVNASTFNSGDFLNFVSANVIASAINQLLLYDRLFDTQPTISSGSGSPISVTGIPTRYTSVTATDPDYIGGNFAFVEVQGTQLSNTSHTWASSTYKDEANATQTFPTQTATTNSIGDRLDQNTNQWFYPLAAGSVGCKAITAIQISANIAAGNVNWCVGHPLVWMPCPIASAMSSIDGINTAFSLVRIFDNACLAFLEVNKPATAATNYTGNIVCISS